MSKEKKNTMNLELLPNELLLDLFNCLNGTDLLHAFYGLNSRFDLLLYKKFRAYRFPLSCSSKRQFDMICQQHLPFIADRVITLVLSDNEYRPGQINLFLSYITSFSQFIHLQSLSIFCIHSYQTLLKIVDELHYLRNLTRLDLRSCSFQNDQVDLQLINNNIWSLPKLTHCHCDVRIDRQNIFTLPTIVSTSLKHVYISGASFRWNEINRLFEYTPRLKCLRIFTIPLYDDTYQSSPILTLIDLKISSFRISDSSKMISLLQNVPNLCRLRVTLFFNLINGYQWEEIIRNYLPKLKVFRLHMQDEFPVDENVEERAGELFNTFRSSFWTDEHQWFVRCFTYGKTIHLETLSNTSYHFQRQLPDSWKSTYPNDNQLEVYNKIHNIYDNIFFEQPFPNNIRLHNIDSLRIKLPIPNKLWSVVESLKKLKQLTISFHADTYQTQLQDLLDQATHLCYLHVSQDASLPLQISLFKYTNASIRRLDLQEYNYRFNEEECIALTQSPLGVQCEILSIQVKNRESIIILVKNMIHLRALYIQYDVDEYSNYLSLTDSSIESHDAHISIKGDLVQWLKDNLSSTYFISRDPNSVNRIRLWIQ